LIRLVWKNCRERRNRTLALMALSVGVVALGWGQPYVGSWRAFTPLTWLPALGGLHLVFFGWRDPRHAQEPDFLDSRPVSLRSLLLAAGLADLLMVTAVAIVTTLVYAAFHPPQYSAYLTAPRLAAGAGCLFLVMGIPCLCVWAVRALGGSRLGGALVLVGPAGTLLLRQYTSGTIQLTGWLEVAWLALAVGIGGSLLVIGLRMRPEQRLGMSMVAMISVIGLHSMLPHPAPNRAPVKYTRSMVSSDVGYAIVQTLPMFGDPLRVWPSRIIRLSDGVEAEVDWPANGVKTFWTKRGAAFAYAGGYLYTLRLSRAGKPILHRVQIGGAADNSMYPSPGADRAIVFWRYGGQRRFRVVDVDTRHKLTAKVERAQEMWWQSNTEIGYIDVKGNRHVARVESVGAEQ
jgi:hypothetical protein